MEAQWLTPVIVLAETGMAYYQLSVRGNETWSHRASNGSIKGEFVITDIHNKKTSCSIIMNELAFDHLNKLILGVADLHSTNLDVNF